MKMALLKMRNMQREIVLCQPLYNVNNTLYKFYMETGWRQSSNDEQKKTKAMFYKLSGLIQGRFKYIFMPENYPNNKMLVFFFQACEMW